MVGAHCDSIHHPPKTVRRWQIRLNAAGETGSLRAFRLAGLEFADRLTVALESLTLLLGDRAGTAARGRQVLVPREFVKLDARRATPARRAHDVKLTLAVGLADGPGLSL